MATTSSEEIIELDGSIMEGGGQILRNSFALSAILHKPINVAKIRAGRNNPGLRHQHLAGIILISQLAQGPVKGDNVGSSNVLYVPKAAPRGGEFIADAVTAGATMLMLQGALPVCCFAKDKVQLTLKGGTDAKMAPPTNTILHVLKPILERFGVRFDMEIVRRGFYPKGGGIIKCTVTPVHTLEPITMVERGKFVEFKGIVYAAQLPHDVAERIAKSVQEGLHKQLPDSAKMRLEIEHVAKDRTAGPGCGVTLMGITDTGCIIAADALGERGLPAEQVGANVAKDFLKQIDEEGCLDERLQDQVIIFMALAKGKSRVRVGEMTLHTHTAIHFTQLLTGCQFSILDDRKTKIIECDGIGWQNPSLK